MSCTPTTLVMLTTDLACSYRFLPEPTSCVKALAELLTDLCAELDIVETFWSNQAFTKKKAEVQCFLPSLTTFAKGSTSDFLRCFHFLPVQSPHTKHGFLLSRRHFCRDGAHECGYHTMPMFIIVASSYHIV